MLKGYSRLQKFGIITGVTFVGLLIISSIVWGLFRAMFLTYVDNYEMAYMFDSRTGEISAINHTGYVLSLPVVTSVHTIDLRPMQLCISANKRTLNCKLVRFNPAGLQTFLSWHGRRDYDIESEKEGGLRDILKSYAFEGTGRTYDFLTIMPSSTDMNMAQESGVQKSVDKPN